jgi:hypothetical protein
MMVRTNATAFGPGEASFINEGSATVQLLFAPVRTPEPDALLLLGAGLIGLFGISRKRLRP